MIYIKLFVSLCEHCLVRRLDVMFYDFLFYCYVRSIEIDRSVSINY